MKARDREKGRAKLGRAKRVAPGAYAFLHDQLGPLEGLHADEGGTERRRYQQQGSGLHPVAPIAEVNRHGHRPAAADQDEGHDGDQDEGNILSADVQGERSEEHTSELQSLMRISYAVFCLKKKKI